jgi:hypothetical protein
MHLGAPGVRPNPLPSPSERGVWFVSGISTRIIDFSLKFDKIHLEINLDWMYSIHELFIKTGLHIGRKDQGKLHQAFLYILIQ